MTISNTFYYLQIQDFVCKYIVCIQKPLARLNMEKKCTVEESEFGQTIIVFIIN